jgi:hypothetical protein
MHKIWYILIINDNWREIRDDFNGYFENTYIAHGKHYLVTVVLQNGETL